jgi:transposase InsO family protein
MARRRLATAGPTPAMTSQGSAHGRFTRAIEQRKQTLKREWGLGRVYRSSNHRARALSHWLDYYNTRRPHSSLGGPPPISRVHNVPRQDI